ncbi:MAG: hypothetical protein JW928_03320, partial [Candidatus Aureabacteria bacterium]|nr:hypothetical protein [Candidatus Auribacterota bacterium]
LINPVYPFGRNMRYIREDKKRTTFYNPWSRKFERIEYTVTGKKESINGEKAVEVQAMFYGVTYSLFLSPTGELLQVSFPSGLSIRQVPSDLNVEPEMFLNLEKIFREMVRNIRKDYKNKGKKND